LQNLIETEQLNLPQVVFNSFFETIVEKGDNYLSDEDFAELINMHQERLFNLDVDVFTGEAEQLNVSIGLASDQQQYDQQEPDSPLLEES